jgi:hypothetical protein
MPKHHHDFKIKIARPSCYFITRRHSSILGLILDERHLSSPPKAWLLLLATYRRMVLDSVRFYYSFLFISWCLVADIVDFDSTVAASTPLLISGHGVLHGACRDSRHISLVVIKFPYRRYQISPFLLHAMYRIYITALISCNVDSLA